MRKIRRIKKPRTFLYEEGVKVLEIFELDNNFDLKFKDFKYEGIYFDVSAKFVKDYKEWLQKQWQREETI